MQVKPGYLVRPGSTKGYWVVDPNDTKDYKFYARAFKTSDTNAKTSLTIDVGVALQKWSSSTNGVSVAVIFESAGSSVLSTPVIFDPAEFSVETIATNQPNNDQLNPFTTNINITGNNASGELTGTTYTMPLISSRNQFLNSTYRNFTILVRIKGDNKITSINVGY